MLGPMAEMCFFKEYLKGCNMKLKWKGFCLFISVIFIAGCAGNPYILRSQQKTLSLDQDKGMVLFTLEANFPLSIYNYYVQEVNQYKFYKKLQSVLIPVVKENYNAGRGIFLYSLILPKGTYRVTHFLGYTSSVFCMQFFLMCNKVVDISPGIISYGGRLKYDSADPGCFSAISKVEDLYGQDVGLFKNTFPTLQDKRIVKDLFY